MLFTALRQRSRFLAVLALLPWMAPAQAESTAPKPDSSARLKRLLTDLEHPDAQTHKLPDPAAVRGDFRDLVEEDPTVLAVLTEKIPSCEKPWTLAVLADTVSGAGYQRAVPALLRSLRRRPGVFFRLRTEGYNPVEAVFGALRALASPADVPAIATVLHDELVPERRRLMVLLADIDTPEAFAAVRHLLASGDRAGQKVKVEILDPSPDPEEQEIAAALARDLQIFKVFPNEKSVRLSRGWKAAMKTEDGPPAENERRYSLSPPYKGYKVVVRQYRGMWIVTELEFAWIT